VNELFSRRHFVFLGIIALIWFGALNQALYDAWTATVVYLVLTLLIVLQLDGARRAQTPLKFPALIPWLIWMAAVWASVPRSFDITTSLWEAWDWTFCMAAFYLTVNSAQAVSAATRATALKAAGLIVIPLVLIAIEQQLTGAPFGYGVMHLPLLGAWHYGHWEIHATLINSIVFSGFLFSWAYLYWPEDAENALTGWLPFACIVVGMLLARSWTVFGAFLFGGLWCRALGRGGLNTTRWVQLLCVGAVLAIFVIVWKMHQPVEGHYYNASMRLEYWRAALRMTAAQPLDGIGLGAYGIAFPFFKHIAGENSRLAHGLPWQIMAETGIFGLLAFTALVVRLTIGLRRAAKTFALWELRLGITLILLLACSLTTIHFDYFLNKLVVVFFVGLLYAHQPSRLTLQPRAFTEWIAIPVLLTLTSFWLSLFQAERLFAAGAYVSALKLNSYAADSYWELAKREADPQKKHILQLRAWRSKKDPRYLQPL